MPSRRTFRTYENCVLYKYFICICNTLIVVFRVGGSYHFECFFDPSFGFRHSYMPIFGSGPLTNRRLLVALLLHMSDISNLAGCDLAVENGTVPRQYVSQVGYDNYRDAQQDDAIGLRAGPHALLNRPVASPTASRHGSPGRSPPSDAAAGTSSRHPPAPPKAPYRRSSRSRSRRGRSRSRHGGRSRSHHGGR